MPNKKKRNALEQHRTSRRIHSTNRPRDQKRQEQRRAAFQQLEEDDDEAEDVSFNLTEAMLNVSNPKLRLWETTMGKTMNQIHAFKKRCPEVWEEEEKCRMDQVANMAIDEWRAMVDETDDEEVEHKRAQDPDLQKKQAISHYNLGMCYENGYGVEGVDIGKAFTHYRLSAELGHPEGMCNVGCCYLEGHGCAYDEAKGFRWIQKAAEAGSFEGSLNLGLCYRRGVGVPVNQQLAVHFFNASAVNKHPDGMYAMAMCHQQGYAGLTPNPALAVSLLSRVVDKYDHPPSMLSLGRCFLEGHGVHAEREMGMKLVALAAQHGHDDARELLDQLLASEPQPDAAAGGSGREGFAMPEAPAHVSVS